MNKNTRFRSGFFVSGAVGLFFLVSNAMAASTCPPGSVNSLDGFECINWTSGTSQTLHTSPTGSLAPEADSSYVGITATGGGAATTLVLDSTEFNLTDLGSMDVIGFSYGHFDASIGNPNSRFMFSLSTTATGVFRLRSFPTNFTGGTVFQQPTGWNHIVMSTNYLKNMGMDLTSISAVELTVINAGVSGGEIYYDNVVRQNVGAGYTHATNLTDTAISVGVSNCTNLNLIFPAANTQAVGSEGTAEGYHVYKSLTGPDSGFVSAGYIGAAATTWNDLNRTSGTAWYKFLSIDTSVSISNSRLMGPEGLIDDPKWGEWNSVFTPGELTPNGIIESLLSEAAAFMNFNNSCPTATPSFTISPTATLSQTFTPTPTPSDSPTYTMSPTNTSTPTVTLTATFSPTVTNTFSPGPSATNTPVFSATITPTFSQTFTPLPSSTITVTLTPPPTATITLTFTPSFTSTMTCVCSPTASPTPQSVSAVLYPNPFRPNDPDPAQRFLRVGRVETGTLMTVYDIAGDQVWATSLTGDFTVDIWDGVNQNGEPVVTGVYFVVLEQPTVGNSVHRVAVVRQ